MTDSPRGALLVGSVPLDNSEEVFRTAASILGDHLRRIPDGETGDRLNWIGWQIAVLQQHPGLEPAPVDPDSYAPLPTVRIREGMDPPSLRFDKLGYSDAALDSWETILQAPAGWRHTGGDPLPGDVPDPTRTDHIVRPYRFVGGCRTGL